MVYACIHDIKNHLKQLRLFHVLNGFEKSLRPDKISYSDHEFSRSASDFLVRILAVHQSPVHNLFEVVLGLPVVLNDQCHQLKFGDNELRIILDFVLVANQLPDEDT